MYVFPGEFGVLSDPRTPKHNYIDAQLAADESHLQDCLGHQIVYRYKATAEKGAFEAYVLAEHGSKIPVP